MADYQPKKPDLLGLNQFENLVIQRIRGFGNFYDEEFRDCFPSTFSFYLTVDEWLELLKIYLTSDSPYGDIKRWGDGRSEKLSKLRDPDGSDEQLEHQLFGLP